MQKFSDVLLTLDSVDDIKRIELYFEDGKPAGVIENKPGSQGSLKVFNHLYKMFGAITLDAAVEGLALFAEHTEDAENCPGKHPNVDRLLNVLENEEPLNVTIVTQ